MIGRELAKIVRPIARAPGAPDTAWHLYTGTPVEGTAPYDPGAMTDTGTVYDPATGLFTFVAKTSHVTLIDGYREALARWTIPMSQFAADFNADQDQLELFWDLTTRTPSTSRIGVALGVLDKDSTGIASCVGSLLGLYTTANYAAAILGQTSNASNTSHTGTTVDALSLAAHFVQYGASDYRLSLIPDGRLTTGYSIYGIGGFGNNPTAAITTTSLHVHVALWHGATTAPGASETWAGRLYYRRTRIGVRIP